MRCPACDVLAGEPRAAHERIRDLESALRLWVGHADTLVKWTEEELQRLPSVKLYLDDVNVARKLLEGTP
jgi:hypothetical protein